MQFLVIAKDHKDALARRLACRHEHLQMVDAFKEKGHFQHAGAILNEQGDMIGSVMVCDFPSTEVMDEVWLKNEPYLTHDVWESVEIHPYRIGPSFANT